MKIGFDAKRAFNNATGLGNYSRAMIKSLVTYFPEHQYHLFTPKNDPLPQMSIMLQELYALECTFAPNEGLKQKTWRTKGIIKDIDREGVQIYHGLSHELPLGIEKTNVKTVVTIHDLIFKHYPNYYPFFDRVIYDLKFKSSCQRANKIIAISEQTKRDIIKFYQIPEDKIQVIYQDCASEFRTLADEEQKSFIRKQYQLPEQFILNVGTIEDRKNLLVILKAIVAQNLKYPLVVIGKKKDYAKEVDAFIEKHQLKDQVIFLKDVSFTNLPIIYQCATLFVYPSKFEGFGIPILEAIRSKVPVIAATGSCLEEAGGPDSLYFHPEDADTLATHITTLWENKNLRDEKIEKSLKYAERFDSENIATQLMKLYQSL